jgi:hypothetical protein
LNPSVPPQCSLCLRGELQSPRRSRMDRPCQRHPGDGQVRPNLNILRLRSTDNLPSVSTRLLFFANDAAQSPENNPISCRNQPPRGRGARRGLGEEASGVAPRRRAREEGLRSEAGFVQATARDDCRATQTPQRPGTLSRLRLPRPRRRAGGRTPIRRGRGCRRMSFRPCSPKRSGKKVLFDRAAASLPITCG